MKEIKKVPELRFEEFRSNWKNALISSISRVYDGTHSTPNYVNDGIPFYSVEHLTANQFERTKYITEEVWIKENKRVKLEKDDILMTRIGDIGTVRLIDWDVRASFYVSLALIKQSDLFISSFLAQAIGSHYFQRELWRRIIHVAFPKKINLGEIGKCKINLPSLPEQQKIADFLTSVDRKIQALTRKVDLLKEYKKGVMQKIFKQEIRFKDDNGGEFSDWGSVFISKVCTIKTGNKDTQNKVENGSYPFYVRSNTIERINTYSRDTEAVLTTGDGVGVGNNFHYINGKFDYHQRVYAMFDFTEGTNGKYFFYFFSSHFGKRVYGMSAKNSVDSVRMDMIAKMPFLKPSLEEQTKIASFLTSIDYKIVADEKKLEKMKKWKKGLLQKMFV